MLKRIFYLEQLNMCQRLLKHLALSESQVCSFKKVEHCSFILKLKFELMSTIIVTSKSIVSNCSLYLIL